MFARSNFFLTFIVAMSLMLGASQGTPQVEKEDSVDGGTTAWEEAGLSLEGKP
ncbi:MAG: hypothetical protein QY329_07810 [Anaerolineales bacterium]|nr:MAG: hypothetical protein QY329_07810 [Anaerolineales bacterium]